MVEISSNIAASAAAPSPSRMPLSTASCSGSVLTAEDGTQRRREVAEQLVVADLEDDLVEAEVGGDVGVGRFRRVRLHLREGSRELPDLPLGRAGGRQ